MTAFIYTACTVELRPVKLFQIIFRPIFARFFGRGGSNGLFEELPTNLLNERLDL